MERQAREEIEERKAKGIPLDDPNNPLLFSSPNRDIVDEINNYHENLNLCDSRSSFPCDVDPAPFSLYSSNVYVCSS